MAKTIGERLRESREEQGLSIEDVAHATRIHANTLQGLEDDDYSSFASTTYAKSFLTLYSRHLDVDATDALKEFTKGSNAPIVGGANYIRSVADAIEPIERAGGASSRHLRSRGNYAEAAPQGKSGGSGGGGGGGGNSHPIFLGLFLLILLALIPILYLAGKGADSPQDAWRNLNRMAGVEPADSSADASGTGTAAPAIEPPAAGADTRPGARVTPAAPMTRNKNDGHRNPTVIEEPSPPIAQLDRDRIDTPKAIPIPVGPPIKARPVVAVPVTIPSEEDDTGDEGNDEAQNNGADADADSTDSDADEDEADGDDDGPTAGSSDN